MLFVVFPKIANAQQDAQYTQYMYNTMAINPAYAGSRDSFSIVGLHRSQWIGLEGAPETQTLSAHAPFGETKKVGLGVSIINDKIGEGVSQETSFDGIFSYVLKTSDVGKLSFGLKVGIHLLNVDFNKLVQHEPELVDINDNIDNKLSPNIGAGFYYYTKKFYAGISVPNILETNHFNPSSSSNMATSFVAKEQINFYLMVGQVYDLTNEWEIKPALLAKMVFGAPLQVDLSSNFWYKKKFIIGAAYRWEAAWSFLLGFNINDSMMVGLAYDKEVTDLGSTSFNDGSFEITFRVELFKRLYKDCTCLRFF